VEQASVALTADHDRLKESSGKGKRVLVVNNEPAFRDLLTITLSADGHTVDRANDGEDAWNMIHRQDYDRILVNLWMPRMGGQKLYELIYDYSHELARKCIFITGASAGDDTHDFIAATGNPSLSKPFPLAEVRRLVLEPLRPG
jgi:DNA-binding response OmpR family regulator